MQVVKNAKLLQKALSVLSVANTSQLQLNPKLLTRKLQKVIWFA